MWAQRAKARKEDFKSIVTNQGKKHFQDIWGNINVKRYWSLRYFDTVNFVRWDNDTVFML